MAHSFLVYRMVTQQLKMTQIYYLVLFLRQKSRYRACSILSGPHQVFTGTVASLPSFELIDVISVCFLVGEVPALLSATGLGLLKAIRGSRHFLVTWLPLVRLLFSVFSASWCALLSPSYKQVNCLGNSTQDNLLLININNRFSFIIFTGLLLSNGRVGHLVGSLGGYLSIIAYAANLSILHFPFPSSIHSSSGPWAP